MATTTRSCLMMTLMIGLAIATRDRGLCDEWQRSIKCELPCSYARPACGYTNSGLRNTTLTCRWKRLHSTSLYRIAWRDPKNIANTQAFATKCFQVIRCDGEGNEGCSGELYISDDDPNCSMFLTSPENTVKFMIDAMYEGNDDDGGGGGGEEERRRREKPQCIGRLPVHKRCMLVNLGKPTIEIRQSGERSIDITPHPSPCLARQKGINGFKHIARVRYWKLKPGSGADANNEEVDEREVEEVEMQADTTRRIRVDDGVRYNFSLTFRLWFGDKWSEPTDYQFLTAPVTAVDVSKLRPNITYKCVSRHHKQIEMQWRKSGEISASNVTIVVMTRAGKWLRTEHHYVPVTDPLNATLVMPRYEPDREIYNITITSQNDKGISRPVTTLLAFDACANTHDLDIEQCWIEQTSNTTARFEWTRPQSLPSSYVMSVASKYNASVRDIEINNNLTTHTVHLQTCEEYRVGIYSQFNGQLVGRCQLEHMQLLDSPVVKVIATGATNASIAIDDAKNCSSHINKYAYTCEPQRRSSQTGGDVEEEAEVVKARDVQKNFTIGPLMPYTTYRCSVSHVFQTKAAKPTRLTITTNMTAPDEPPIFVVKKSKTSPHGYNVSWSEPAHKNGVVGVYLIKITNNKVANNASNCAMTDKENSVCRYPNATFAAQLNLSASAGIQMSACCLPTTDGEGGEDEKLLCSQYSESYTIKVGELTNYLWMVIIVVLVIVFPFVVQNCKPKSNPFDIQPKIDSEILESFKLTPRGGGGGGGNKPITENGGGDGVGRLETATTGERYDPVDEWRKRLNSNVATKAAVAEEEEASRKYYEFSPPPRPSNMPTLFRDDRDHCEELEAREEEALEYNNATTNGYTSGVFDDHRQHNATTTTATTTTTLKQHFEDDNDDEEDDDDEDDDDDVTAKLLVVAPTAKLECDKRLYHIFPYDQLESGEAEDINTGPPHHNPPTTDDRSYFADDQDDVLFLSAATQARQHQQQSKTDEYVDSFEQCQQQQQPLGPLLFASQNNNSNNANAQPFGSYMCESILR